MSEWPVAFDPQGRIRKDTAARPWRRIEELRPDLLRSRCVTKKTLPRADASACQTDLASLLSHELRTPLNAIIGFAEMLDREVLGNVGNQRYREYARHIRDSGTHLSGIISDLLSVIPNDGNALPTEPIDPAVAVDDCLSVLRPDAMDAGVRLEGRKSDIRARLLADHNAVTKILTVLVRDAISSARRGDRITVSVDLNARRRGLIYAIDRPIQRSRRMLNRGTSGGKADSDHPSHLQPVPPDLGPAIWNWLVRLNGGRLDLERNRESGWMARVGFPERMLRRVRGSLDGGAKLARH